MRNIYVDIETYKEKGKELLPILNTNEFVLGGVLEGEEIKYFTTPRRLLRYLKLQLDTSEEDITIWSHYGAYDFYGTWKHQLKEDITKGYINVIRPNPTLAIINNRHYWTDTITYWGMSLEKYGEKRGIKKGKLPEKLDMEKLKPYLKRDLEITKDMIEYAKSLCKKMGYNPRKLLTGPSTAMKSFLSHLNKQEKSGWIMKKGCIHKNPETIGFLQQASKGGIIRAFKKGKYEECTYIDINSSYWKSIEDMPLPDLLKERHLKKELLQFLNPEIVLKREGVVKAIIRTKKLHVGLLPIRHKGRGEDRHKLKYPNQEGVLTGYWTTAEIRYAITKGYELISLEEAVIYEKNLNFNPLKSYILKLWEQRKLHKDEPLANKFFKGLGNHLYGKFIQITDEKDYKWIHRKDWDIYKEKGWKIEYSQQEYCISKKRERYIPKYHSTIWGVMIAGYARIRLLEDLHKIKRENLLYCDTDGIIIRGKIPESIKMGDNLGEYKIEEKGTAYIKGPKVYYIGEKISMSGVPRKEQKKSIIENDEVIELQEMIGLKEAVKNNNFELLGTFKTVKKQFKEEIQFDVPYIYEEGTI